MREAFPNACRALNILERRKGVAGVVGGTPFGGSSTCHCRRIRRQAHAGHRSLTSDDRACTARTYKVSAAPLAPASVAMTIRSRGEWRITAGLAVIELRHGARPEWVMTCSVGVATGIERRGLASDTEREKVRRGSRGLWGCGGVSFGRVGPGSFAAAAGRCAEWCVGRGRVG